MRDLVADLRERLAVARRGGIGVGPEKHTARGKLLVRDRVDRLLDPGSPFLELSPLAATGMYGDAACTSSAGIVTGIGRVSGREVRGRRQRRDGQGRHLLPDHGQEAPARADRRRRQPAALRLPRRLRRRVPADAGRGVPRPEHFGRIFFNQANLSARGIPQIASVMGSCTAGGAYVPAMSDETIIVRNQGTIFLGGPPLVKAATGEVVTAEDLGGGDVHARTTGVVDHLADDDAHALAIVRSIVATLPEEAPSLTAHPVEEPHEDPPGLYDVVPDRHPHAVRRPRGDPPGRRRQPVPRVQAAVRRDAGLRVRPDLGPRGRHRRQQRDPVQRVGAQGRALHRAVQPAPDPAGVPAEHLRLHGRQGVREQGHRPRRRQAGHRGRVLAWSRSSPSSSAARSAPATTACAAAPTTRGSSGCGPTPGSR